MSKKAWVLRSRDGVSIHAGLRRIAGGFDHQMRFGWEYALSRRWKWMQHAYILLFGVVDLPTRLRARIVGSTARGGEADKTIVDFGTGTGVYAYFCSRQRERKVIAVDVDGERVSDINRIAQLLGRNRLVAVCSDERFFATCSDGQIGLILAIEVLQYCLQLEDALREMRRSLGQDGVLIAHVPVRNKLAPHEHHLFTDERLLTLAEAAGFATVTIQKTFGPTATRLCFLFERCSHWPVVLGLAFPFLLLAASCTPHFSKSGESRLIVARTA
jgi:SAM-dependent methyltransferase